LFRTRERAFKQFKCPILNVLIVYLFIMFSNSFLCTLDIGDGLWKYHKTSKNVWTGEWCYEVISMIMLLKQ